MMRAGGVFWNLDLCPRCMLLKADTQKHLVTMIISQHSFINGGQFFHFCGLLQIDVRIKQTNNDKKHSGGVIKELPCLIVLIVVHLGRLELFSHIPLAAARAAPIEEASFVFAYLI